eukprot:TRINITY_DN19688_c0_g1_i2.p1 TRINITY_DN19688_c0_g1~~TRINITY_DN19688_c0_g1_i2.p1  ORF type:complete len:756 (-),score=119.31 TRINITY_DN19688_c0_g1_i2:28-2295(-)
MLQLFSILLLDSLALAFAASAFEHLFDGKPEHGFVDQAGDVPDANECFQTHQGNLAECLTRVVVKDPWGCHANLKPASARASSWIYCCGGAVIPEVLVSPCPPLRCCTPAKIIVEPKKVIAEGRTPAWLSCSKATDKRWSLLRTMLSYNGFHGEEAVQDLAAALASSQEWQEVERLRFSGVRYDWEEMRATDHCIMGYMHALYILATGSKDEELREKCHWKLLKLLNVGPLATDAVTFAWLVDLADWPIPAKEMVAFALRARGTDISASIVVPPPVDWQSVDTSQAATSAPLPRGVFVLTSHMFALDAAFAFAGAASQGRHSGVVHWYGYPDKFRRKNYTHVERLCRLKEPKVTCGGSGALEIDQLLELITFGRGRRSSRWPHSIHADGTGPPSSRSGRDGIQWSGLVREVQALLHGPLSSAIEGNVLVCGYPSVVCFAMDAALEETGSNFLVTALSGVPVEYVAPSLQPHIIGRLRSMSRTANRGLLCQSHFDEVYLATTVGPEVVPWVPFGARYISSALGSSVQPPAGSSATAADAVPLPAAITNDASSQILVSRLKLPFGIAAGMMWTMLEDLCSAGHHSCPYQFVSYEYFFDYDALSDFRATVFFPWNWELITFLEWYALSLPIFVPGPSWAVPLILDTLKAIPYLTARSNATAAWTNLREEWSYGGKHHEDHVKAAGNPFQVEAWWSHTDYMRLPHVRRFRHLADLLAQVASCDFKPWASTLRARNREVHRESARYYAELVSRAGEVLAH